MPRKRERVTVLTSGGATFLQVPRLKKKAQEVPQTNVPHKFVRSVAKRENKERLPLSIQLHMGKGACENPLVHSAPCRERCDLLHPKSDAQSLLLLAGGGKKASAAPKKSAGVENQKTAEANTGAWPFKVVVSRLRCWVELNLLHKRKIARVCLRRTSPPCAVGVPLASTTAKAPPRGAARGREAAVVVRGSAAGGKTGERKRMAPASPEKPSPVKSGDAVVPEAAAGGRRKRKLLSPDFVSGDELD